MAYFQKKYFVRDEEIPEGYKRLQRAITILDNNPLFRQLNGSIHPKPSHLTGKGSIATVTKNGEIYTNYLAHLSPEEWSYVIAHCLLHLAFGHFDYDKLPKDKEFYPEVWNKACDIYITRFLADIQFGKPLFDDPLEEYSIKLNDEKKIYKYILETEGEHPKQTYGFNSVNGLDMFDTKHPVHYKNGEENGFTKQFSYAIMNSIKGAVCDVSGRDIETVKDTPVTRAAAWFLSHYPLLGGLAASFKIIEDVDICHRYEIHIAAVDAIHGEIYANPSCMFTEDEWKFVLAHEYLHAGLCHHQRCQGRNPYLWNIACDYVVNDWLHEMQIGTMPEEGLLYDEKLHGMSVESIYDIIVKEMRKFKKHATFRGYGKGDIFGGNSPHFEGLGKGVTLDDFFKNALREGLDFHVIKSRGFLPAGLVEEIRALTTPPIPWEVELAEWFDINFPPLEKHRTYARPSRRQGATPDIPRPSYTIRDEDITSRTFGVVVDTSGSMSTKEIGHALGAIASYAVAKEVPFVRVIFCDAAATDVGYLAPEDIAGRVEVTGRGGTILQPGVDTIEKAKDFPATGPILVITDGEIEHNLKIRRNHAFLLPKGRRLPFRAKGKVFYMDVR